MSNIYRHVMFRVIITFAVVSYFRVHLRDSTRQAVLDVMQGHPLPPPDLLNALADDTLTVVHNSSKYIPDTSVIVPEINFMWALYKASRLVLH